MMKRLKKNIHQRLMVALLSIVLLGSCNNYLDVQPKGVRLLQTVNDYDLWLNNSFIVQSVPNQLYLLADNVDNPNIPNPPTATNDLVYTWSQQFSAESTTEPIIWKDLYKSIYYFNTVLDGIDKATGGTAEMKKNIKAEALLGRAFNYFFLVNAYGKFYNANTAAQDLAVPFVTSIDLAAPTPKRSTVQEIYDHIFADIEAAIPDLPIDNSKNRYRGTVAGAYSVLARIYFYRGDYTKAAQNAQLALDKGQNEIQDYSIMADKNGIGNLMVRPGAIYARLSTTTAYFPKATLDFLKTYDTKDLRLNFYYTNLGDYSFDSRGLVGYLSYNIYTNWGTSVAEMHLIIAEAAARANDLTKAIDQLDLVRKKRFKSQDYVKYDPASPVQEDVLQKILAERTFEFNFTTTRWFDMRRLNAEGRMPDVNRYDGQGNVIATLPAGSNKYTLQIPRQVMYFNPDWPQNPWD